MGKARPAPESPARAAHVSISPNTSSPGRASEGSDCGGSSARNR